jgi:hypothetical protein
MIGRQRATAPVLGCAWTSSRAVRPSIENPAAGVFALFTLRAFDNTRKRGGLLLSREEQRRARQVDCAGASWCARGRFADVMFRQKGEGGLPTWPAGFAGSLQSSPTDAWQIRSRVWVEAESGIYIEAAFLGTSNSSAVARR